MVSVTYTHALRNGVRFQYPAIPHVRSESVECLKSTIYHGIMPHPHRFPLMVETNNQQLLSRAWVAIDEIPI